MKNRFGSPFGVQWLFEEVDKGGGDDDKARRNLQNLLDKKNGDAIALATDLLSENANLREDKRQLKKTQIPEGAVVLTGKDAEKWTAFNELGTPDEIQQRINDSEAAVNERNELKAEKVISRAASIAGYKSDVLADLAKSKGFQIEVEGEGDAAKVVARYKDGEKDVSKPLSEYVESSLAAYLPSLQVESATPAKPVVPFPRGSAVGGGKPTSLAEQIRAEEAAKKQKTDEVAKVPSLEERMHMTR